MKEKKNLFSKEPKLNKFIQKIRGLKQAHQGVINFRPKGDVISDLERMAPNIKKKLIYIYI